MVLNIKAIFAAGAARLALAWDSLIRPPLAPADLALLDAVRRLTGPQIRLVEFVELDPAAVPGTAAAGKFIASGRRLRDHDLCIVTFAAVQLTPAGMARGAEGRTQ